MILLLFSSWSLAALLVGPSVSEAAWKPPTNLSAPSVLSMGPLVATGADGTTVAVWRRFDGTQPPSTCCHRIEARVRPPGGKFGQTRILSAPGRNAFVGGVSAGPDGTAIVIWTRFDGTQPPFTCCQRVQVRVRPSGGPFGPAKTLSEAGQDAMAPEVGIGRDGRAVATWTREETPFGPRRLQARFRGAGNGGSPSFGKVQNLIPADEYAYSPDLDVAPSGRAIVIWQRYNGQYNRIVGKLRAPGERFGAERRNLSEGGANADYPAVDIGARGRALAAWTTDRFSPDYGVESRRRAPNGHFGAVATVSKTVTENYPAVAIDATGRASVAWQEDVASGTRIKVRTRPRHGGFGNGQFLSPFGENSYDPVLSIGPGGTAFAGWLLAGADYLAQARVRRPGHSNFVMQETLSEGGEDATDLGIAGGPRGRAIAVWQRSDGSDLRVQASRYAP